MTRKKIDNRIRVMIENGVASGHRTMFIVVGDKGKDQVVILHHMLSKATVRAHPSVLWCYKKELGFSSHRKKRMRQLQKRLQSGKINVNEDSPFEMFVAATNIRYCYYSETHKILGNTFGMCVLQDFEAMTPNLLARTIETVEGGGVVVILLRSLSSLRQLYTMTMDVHARYRTEAHQDVVGRFNERFILSLASCKTCVILDDSLNVLPHSSHILSVTPVPSRSLESNQSSSELKDLKETLRDTQPVGVLVNLCHTLDQGKALLKCVEAISEKSLRSTVSVTAARGRGKSAALGLAIAGAVAFGYANIFVTSPSPENLHTLFQFVLKGFDALEYQEHLDYDLVQSTNPDFNKAVVRINVFRDHRQTIQYIHPSDAKMLGQAELVVIDEAAAIPLPLVKDLLGPYLVFLSSTINGYEGTGRSLSLKLLDQLRKQAVPSGISAEKAKKEDISVATGRVLHEVTLDESIRYKPGDQVEGWLTDLLCLDATAVLPILSGCPVPQSCDLYYINRDTLFSYHKASESFLQRLMSLYVASHYKNSPNDLQMMSDAPAHHLFCLLGPVNPTSKNLPEVLVVIQVCLEGDMSKASVADGMKRGRKAAGDLIPWTIAQQFQDDEFPSLAGARIVRIATHPDFQGMGYGARALELLQQYYEFKIPNVAEESVKQEIKSIPEEEVGLLKEKIGPRKSLPPLLLKLSERKPERLDYLGVSYGVTESLLKFWRRAGFIPTYLRQTPNDLTGEYSCIMMKVVNSGPSECDSNWLHEFFIDFRRRFVSLLGAEFRIFSPRLALGLLQNQNIKVPPTAVSREELEIHVNKYERKRLEAYSRNLVDYHLITDLLPRIAELYSIQKMGDLKLAATQAAILLSLGLQRKRVDTVASELSLPVSQVLALFQRCMKQCATFFSAVEVQAIESSLAAPRHASMQPLEQGLGEELSEAARELREKQREEVKQMEKEDLRQYTIKGSEKDWGQALGTGGVKGLVSVKSGYKRPLVESTDKMDHPPQKGKKSKGKKS